MRGAAIVAHRNGVHIYWNAPTQENDVERQIGFVSLIVERQYGGAVIAPDNRSFSVRRFSSCWVGIFRS